MADLITITRKQLQAEIHEARAEALRDAADGVGVTGGNLIYPLEFDHAEDARQTKAYLLFLAHANDEATR